MFSPRSPLCALSSVYPLGSYNCVYSVHASLQRSVFNICVTLSPVYSLGYDMGNPDL